jgi:hypothetical protein
MVRKLTGFAGAEAVLQDARLDVNRAFATSHRTAGLFGSRRRLSDPPCI